MVRNKLRINTPETECIKRSAKARYDIRMWTRLNAYTEYINIILGALYSVAQLQGNEYMRITREKLACIS